MTILALEEIRELRAFRFWLGVLVVVLLGSGNPTSSFGQDSQTAAVPTFPTGAVAAFPQAVEPQNEKLVANNVFIRLDVPTDQRAWVVESQEVLLADPTATIDKSKPIKTEKGIGFIVPQLARGVYVAWYEPSTANQRGQSMKLMIVPALIADAGIKRGVPGGDIEVRVRIDSPTIQRKDHTNRENVSVSVKLQSENLSVANLAPGQPATVSTNSEGYALWKVHINDAGVAPLTATAENFEPVTVDVVGMPTSARTFREAEVLVAERRASEQEASARDAATKVAQLEATLAQQKAQAETQIAEVRSEEISQAEIDSRIGEIKKGVKNLESAAKKAREASRNAAKDSSEARSVANNLAAQLPTLQPPSIGESELKPGDVLLVLGSTPLISPAIRLFERKQLGGEALYSHASLYVGKIRGTGMVAEMWSEGYWITPLSVSTQGCLIVDAYRWEGIDDEKRKEIADRALNLYGPASKFTTYLTPSSGSPLPYAYEQIGLLSAAATHIQEILLRLSAKNLVDPRAGGRRKMICSELVAWVYRDVGLDLEVTYWKKLIDANLLTTDDRRKDYTTPNMLARSRNLHEVGRYLGP